MHDAHRTHTRRSVLALASLTLTVSLQAGDALRARQLTAQEKADTRWAVVAEAMGREGVVQPGGVYRVSLPRSDLAVRVGGERGVAVKPALALGSWLAFKRVGDSAIAMGDLVLTEAEVAPVVAALQERGVRQTAIHHHLLHESPRVLYVHVHASGDPVRLAEAVRAAADLTETPPPAGRAAAASGRAEAVALDTARLAAILGHGGNVNGGVYQVSVPRAETIEEHGVEIPPAMGVATALNFQPTGDGKAAITGDFVLTADEVNPVIRALRAAGIEPTALHNHLLHEEPRLFFVHFWAHDDALRLARGLRAALDRTNSARPER